MIQSSPRLSARVRRPATSEPPAGSENSWHQTFSADASGGRYFRFWSSPAKAIMVGPHMPWPMMNIPLSLPNAPSSCCQITRSIGVAPRPPYSFGQCRQAQPPSAFFFCQALPTSTISSFCSRMRPSEVFDSSASYCFGALASIHFRAVARNSASCGVSSKFIWLLLSAAFPGRCAARSDALLIRDPSMSSSGGSRLCGAAQGRCTASGTRTLSTLGRYLVERHVLVDPDIAGQAEHALGDDVAHDLVGAAFDPGAGRAQQHCLEFPGGLRIRGAAQHAGGALQVQRVG